VEACRWTRLSGRSGITRLRLAEKGSNLNSYRNVRPEASASTERRRLSWVTRSVTRHDALPPKNRPSTRCGLDDRCNSCRWTSSVTVVPAGFLRPAHRVNLKALLSACDTRSRLCESEAAVRSSTASVTLRCARARMHVSQSSGTAARLCVIELCSCRVRGTGQLRAAQREPGCNNVGSRAQNLQLRYGSVIKQCGDRPHSCCPAPLQ
jgi:hypothetical protein